MVNSLAIYFFWCLAQQRVTDDVSMYFQESRKSGLRLQGGFAPVALVSYKISVHFADAKLVFLFLMAFKITRRQVGHISGY